MNVLKYIPKPIGDVILAPLAFQRDPKEAKVQFRQSLLRLKLAAAGAFASYKLFGTLNPHLRGAELLLTASVIYSASMPAGQILFGFGAWYVGAFALKLGLFSKITSIYSLASNGSTILSGMFLIGVGSIAINESEKTSWGNFSGFLEPYIKG